MIDWLWNAWTYVAPFVLVAMGVSAFRALRRPHGRFMGVIYAIDAVAFTTIGLALAGVIVVSWFP